MGGSEGMDKRKEKIHNDKGTIWYSDWSKITTSTATGCHAKEDGNNIVINSGNMATVLDAEVIKNSEQIKRI